MNGHSSLSTMRLYGALIAIVSGAYSVYLSMTGTGMTTGAWLMAVLGVIVIVHGIVLLLPAARVLGAYSGPLMILYALLMLGNQLRMELTDGGMNDGMGTGTNNSMIELVGADPGMVAIAVLMLGSGIIMTVRMDRMTA